MSCPTAAEVTPNAQAAPTAGATPNAEAALDPASNGEVAFDPASNGQVAFDPAIGGEKRPHGERGGERRRRPGPGPGLGGDRALAELALGQHGVVARRQLLALGFGRRAIDGRVERGGLHGVHRGVYAVGHRGLTGDGHVMAAVLAGGDGAVASHRTAGELWGICPGLATAVEVTVPGKRRDRSGIVHYRSTVLEDERTEVRGIPVTTGFRTLLDLAAVFDGRRLERAVHEAEVRGLRESVSLERLIARHRGRRGVGLLGTVLADGRLGAHVTRNELELGFLELIADSRLPAPVANGSFPVLDGMVEIDFAWPDRRLAVELDGHATHSTRRGFERDRERDRALQRAGWRVVRITWRQLHRGRDRVAADLRALLAGSS